MEEVLITPINFNKICRVCLLENDNMISIFSELCEDNSADYVYELLLSISSIKVQADDGLPSLICNTCIENANSSFRFQKQCNKSQAILDACLMQFHQLEVEANNESDINCDETEKPNELTETRNEDDSNDSFEFALIYRNENVVLADPLVVSENDLRDCFEETKPSLFVKEEDEYSEENLEMVTTSDVMPRPKVVLDKIIQKKQLKSDEKKNKTGENLSMKYYCKILENGEKIYACNLCNKSYKYGSSLRIHMRNHTKEEPYVCNVCDKSFKQYGALLYHHRSHTGEQPYSCKICGKKYRQSGTLTAHMRVHTGAKPFLCSICGRGFRQAPDLRYHMRTHTKEKPYMCTVCGKTMSMQCHLVEHMRTHTGERPFKCNECNKAFPSSTGLKRHTIIHTGLKPYTCDVCDKSFNRSSTLRVHSKIHTDERPHICPVCNKGFIQAQVLKAHIVTHSSEFSVKQLVT